ncbi:MAG: hypothetical protein ASARMPRED_006114 [Alectoria sarmentosa]|nr:MAG: hypothetical protein ASARMPRED_006114 [Alectoria sarmentosa]
MASEDTCADTTQYKLQRKDSKLRRAVTFFKHLGLKSSRLKSSGSSSAHETESFDMWLAKRKRFEMDDTSHDAPPLMELADSNRKSHVLRSNPEKKSKTVYEMEGTTLYTSWGLDELPRYSQEAGTAVEPCELGIGNLVMAPQSNAAARDTYSPLTGVGAQFEVAQNDAEPREDMLVSPISTVQGSFMSQSDGVDRSCHAESGLVSPTYSDSGIVPSLEVVDQHWRQINVTPALNGSLLSSENDGRLYDGEVSSTESQVKELREMVRVLNEEWIRRCESTLDLALRASALSPRTLFETGAKTLQHVFRGVLPETFDAVFALAHITCASAYIIHRDDNLHCWNEFFQDILKWQHLMPNESDKRLFIRLVNLLWWPQDSSVKLSCGNYFLDETSGTLVPLRKPAVGFDASSSIEIKGSRLPQWPSKPASMTILNFLKNGAALQECLRFLDGIEYAIVKERSKNYPTHLAWYAQNHVTNIEEMLNTIIYPLDRCDGIEALRGGIDYTVTALRDGSLRSVREVEVSLISNGKSSCLSAQIYKRYLDAVASTCDRAMHEAGLSWRDRCYATHLDTVLASIVEIDTRRRPKRIVPCHQRNTNVDPMPDTKQGFSGSILTPSSNETQLNYITRDVLLGPISFSNHRRHKLPSLPGNLYWLAAGPFIELETPHAYYSQSWEYCGAFV